MKKKILSIFLLCIMLSATVFVLAGCKPRKPLEPWDVGTWHLENTGTNNGDYWHGRTFSDDVTFKFSKKPQTFEMKTYGGAIKKGTYTRSQGEGGWQTPTEIALSFNDGTKGSGQVYYDSNSSLFFPATKWFKRGFIRIGEILYSITDEKMDMYSRGQWQKAINTEKEKLHDFLNNNLKRINAGYPKYSFGGGEWAWYISRGTIIEENGNCYFLDSYDNSKVEIWALKYYYFYNLNDNGEFSLTNKPIMSVSAIMIRTIDAKYHSYDETYIRNNVIYLI